MLAALDDESEAFHAAVDRVTEDMDASDVLAEACEFDDARLTKLMNAYRARHDSKENHAYYLWLLDNLFEDAAIRAAEGIARRREN
ncbi:hypothetical protein BSIN_4031 [Burkholderia singularis]|uniref:Uncharacterized protein n=1 Tax=Burkholderia singularis TaxID=1503053 RepID=A0A238H7I7_9BURK|nr:hypothetical protein BSIN_4031 [Burkholderia singularis]